MPFTAAHPAAALPLRRVLGRAGVGTALAIGSVTPDLVYFVPIELSRTESHSLAGLLWYCLPMGLAAYVVFHRVVKRPLVALLPDAVHRRVAPAIVPGLPAASWAAVAISLLAGAMTHLAWDAFTHLDAPHVTFLPRLRDWLIANGTSHGFLYRTLQHGSTLLGLGLLGVWASRWLQSAPPGPVPPGPRLAAPVRAAVVSLIVVAAVVAGLERGIPALRWPLDAQVAFRFLNRFIAPAVSAIGLGVLLFSVAWHAAERWDAFTGKGRRAGA